MKKPGHKHLKQHYHKLIKIRELKKFFVNYKKNMTSFKFEREEANQ